MDGVQGNGFTARIAEFGRFWEFVGAFLARAVLGRPEGRRSAAAARLLRQMHEIGYRSVPVIMITGAFVGMTLALQSYHQLAHMGLATRLGGLINISVVKELGPVLAAVMLAGRVGGALTAELGTMRVTDQIEALRAMGVDPLKHLVWPRVAACVLLTPLLTLYADLLGVLGGWLIGVQLYGINAQAFWGFSAQVVEAWDLLIGVGKGLFFGAAIGMISCFKGFHCGKGAQGVGRACTEAFVYSFLSILALNFVLAWVTRAIYETFWGLRVML